MEDDTILELLDIYMDLVEKQDEIIYRLGKIVSMQATDMELLRNDMEFSDKRLEENIKIVKEVIDEYEKLKRLDDYKP